VRVASLVPAATDLLLAMGLSDRLVAVSNWDTDRAEISGLPKVGDYRTIDWEKLSVLRPGVMIVQFREDKMPPGLRERAAELGIRLLNVKINRLDDVFTTLRQLGEAIDDPAAATRTENQLRTQLDAVRARVAAREAVATLITRAEPGSSLACVGGGNYLDEILTIAGGRNVLHGGENSYPTIDRERLIELNPSAVLALLPSASPQVVEQARSFWKSVPQVSAVRDGRVYLLTESHLLLPGASVGRVAEQFAEKLHPTTAPTGGG
jgi:ABC-type Fe3+-hydroxamate transport system substrate-binding protein